MKWKEVVRSEEAEREVAPEEDEDEEEEEAEEEEEREDERIPTYIPTPLIPLYIPTPIGNSVSGGERMDNFEDLGGGEMKIGNDKASLTSEGNKDFLKGRFLKKI